MRNSAFFFQYILHPKKVGAIMPSSSFLANKMTFRIDFSKAKYIVEYGPGTGIFTEEIIKNKQSDTFLLLVEFNEKFYKRLKKKYEKENNVFIVNGSAENIDQYLMKYGFPHIDYVICGLPFATLSPKASKIILKKTKLALKEDGVFIMFQYTLFMKAMIQQHFPQIDIQKEIRNLPPAYVLTCSI